MFGKLSKWKDSIDLLIQNNSVKINQTKGKLEQNEVRNQNQTSSKPLFFQILLYWIASDVMCATLRLKKKNTKKCRKPIFNFFAKIHLQLRHTQESFRWSFGSSTEQMKFWTTITHPAHLQSVNEDTVRRDDKVSSTLWKH